ncbi:hypothetical protein AVEN_97528-1 [Araneus ventricosus]|uniref:Uncharacterized protein n=1 Tax=Araneus ventricosus TaxID=182803 RepID=A0A4Y2KLT7_ARAVE|nr:hypothetical protein AVEN_97528-1 [Araneus ventricosus]
MLESDSNFLPVIACQWINLCLEGQDVRCSMAEIRPAQFRSKGPGNDPTAICPLHYCVMDDSLEELEGSETDHGPPNVHGCRLRKLLHMVSLPVPGSFLIETLMVQCLRL